MAVYQTSYALSNPLISDEYAVFHPVKATDFGVLQPGANGTVIDGGFSAAKLAASTTGGSLATSTGAFKISYITAQGESSASAEATIAVTGATGRVTVTLPALPSATAGSPEAFAAPIIGWRVYSGNGSGNALLNAAANSTVEVQQSFVTTVGTIAGFPVSQASVQVIIYGLGAAPPAINQSGIQPPLPLMVASASVDYFLLVKRDFRAQKLVEWARPNSSSDPAGLLISSADCIAPVWQASTAITNYQGSSVANSSFLVLNGFVFACTTAGTTASTVPAFNFTQGATTTDGTAVWTCLGQKGIVRLRFTNTNTGVSGSPVAQDYYVMQL